ncbi:MAG: peptidylprolyl isomerase [Sphingobacteriia bacterium]|nr:peptidylprolyl isomerase [Sphingobacteriia bacterium]
MKKFFIIALLFFACKPKHVNPHVLIQTGFGDIEVELYPKQAPKTVAAFLSYVDSGYYERCNFYRVLSDENQPSNAPKTELIQGGIWKTKKNATLHLKGIENETTQQTGILHTNGTISLARLEPGTATTEFFICIGNQPGLNYGGENIADKQGYAAFGRVVKGMDIVKNIYKQNENNQYFDPPVPIINIVRE